jgi:site-specific DNA-methyltransferase (adenine-specific)
MQNSVAADSPPINVSTRLIKGDCLEVMPTLERASVAMCFADLPYATAKHRHTRNAWDVAFDLSRFWALRSHLRPNATLAFTASQPFTTHLVQSNLTCFKYCLVWDKKFSGSFVKANAMPLRVHEDVVVFCEGATTYNPQKTLRDKPIKAGANRCNSLSSPIAVANDAYLTKIYTDKHPISIISISSRSDKRGFHPTQKPVALLEWLIKTYTNPNDTILDPCAGSGTTAIAALRTGRHSICIEKDATYFGVMQKRVGEERARLGLPPM